MVIALTLLSGAVCACGEKPRTQSQGVAENVETTQPQKKKPKAGVQKAVSSAKEKLKTKTVSVNAQGKVQPKVRPRPKAKAIKWDSNIQWVSWEEGRTRSAAEGKALCLVIYTDWCPRCRELGPVFRDAEVEALAQKVIMVKQNQDEKPAWLAAYAAQGRYVPRIIFFGSDGNPIPSITSGNQRYPYFYTPRSAKVLARSIAKAAGQ
jgi:hypothetical protein